MAEIVTLIDARHERLARKVFGMLNAGQTDEAMAEIAALNERNKRLADARRQAKDDPTP